MPTYHHLINRIIAFYSNQSVVRLVRVHGILIVFRGASIAPIYWPRTPHRPGRDGRVEGASSREPQTRRTSALRPPLGVPAKASGARMHAPALCCPDPQGAALATVLPASAALILVAAWLPRAA